MRIRNFGQTWAFEPARIEEPADEAALAEVVRRSRKLRVAGSRHSWSTGIVTEDTLVSLAKLDRVIRVERDRVVVQAGKTLKALIAELATHGLALANLGSIVDQTLAGALATATHGTGIAWRCLASQVRSFRMIDGTGEARTYARGDREFAAILTGLGCFGVIVELEIDVVPAFQLHAITESAPLARVIEHLDDYVYGYDHFKFWWLVPSDDAVLFCNNRTDRPANERARTKLMRWLRDDLLSVGVYRSMVALGKLRPRALVPRINRMLTRQVGKRFERVCASQVGFLTPNPPVHRESEWAFDYANAREILVAYRELFLTFGHTFNFIQEVRFTRADEFWISPAYGRDSMWLSLYNIAGDALWREQLATFDAFCRRHGGRPHWGKDATGGFERAYLDTQFARLPEFRALAKQLDPDGKLVNRFTAAIL